MGVGLEEDSSSPGTSLQLMTRIDNHDNTSKL